MKSWRNLLKDFLTYLKIERGLSENSIKSYSYDIQKLIIFLLITDAEIVKIKSNDKRKILDYIYEK